MLPRLGSSAFVNLATYRKTYLVAEDGGGGVVGCNRTEAREWECFRLYRLDETHVALQARSGHYVRSTEPASLFSYFAPGLRADCKEIGTDARFRVESVKNGTAVLLIGPEGYVSAQDDGRLTAKTKSVSTREMFTLDSAAPSCRWAVTGGNIQELKQVQEFATVQSVGASSAPSSSVPALVVSKTSPAMASPSPTSAPVSTQASDADAGEAVDESEDGWAAADDDDDDDDDAGDVDEEEEEDAELAHDGDADAAEPEGEAAAETEQASESDEEEDDEPPPPQTSTTAPTTPGGAPAAEKPRLSPKFAFDGDAAVFWDIENVAVPKGADAFRLVSKIRDFVSGTVAWKVFEAFGDVTHVPPVVTKALHDAGVKLTHVVADTKNKADFMIIRGITEFVFDMAKAKSPGLVVLISSDVNFAPTLQSLRASSSFVRTVVIHGPASRSLLDACDQAVKWSMFAPKVPRASTAAPSKAGKTTKAGKTNKTPTRAFHASPATPHGSGLGSGPGQKRPAKAPAAAKEQWGCVPCKKLFKSEVLVKQHQASSGHYGVRKVTVHRPVMNATAKAVARPAVQARPQADEHRAKERHAPHAAAHHAHHHAATAAAAAGAHAAAAVAKPRKEAEHHGEHRKAHQRGGEQHAASKEVKEGWTCKQCHAKFGTAASLQQHHASAKHHA